MLARKTRSTQPERSQLRTTTKARLYFNSTGEFALDGGGCYGELSMSAILGPEGERSEPLERRRRHAAACSGEKQLVPRYLIYGNQGHNREM